MTRHLYAGLIRFAVVAVHADNRQNNQATRKKARNERRTKMRTVKATARPAVAERGEQVDEHGLHHQIVTWHMRLLNPTRYVRNRPLVDIGAPPCGVRLRPPPLTPSPCKVTTAI